MAVEPPAVALAPGPGSRLVASRPPGALTSLRSLVSARPLLAAATAAIWSAFAAYQLLLVREGPIGYWQDSSSYAAVAGHRLFSLGLLAGSRPPLTPLLWKLTGTPGSFAVVDTCIAICCWSVLALATARLVRPGIARLLAGGVVLAFSCSWQVAEWNWNFLSEGPALSLTALLLAGLLLVAGGSPRLGAVLAALAGSLLAFDRDQEVFSLGLAVLATLALLGLRAWLRRWRGAPPGSSAPLVAAGLVLLVAVSLAGSAELYSGRNTVNVDDVFVVRVFPFPARVAWFSAHGMPEGRRIDQVAAEVPTPRGEAKVVGINLEAPVFSRLRSWFAHGAEQAYVEYLLTHPGYDLTAPLASPALTYNDAGGNLAFYGGLGGRDPVRSPLPVSAVLYPSLPLLAGLGTVFSGLFLLARRRRQVLGVLGGFVLFGGCSMLIAWHGDGMEVARHMLEGNVAVHLAVVLLAILALLGERETATAPRARPGVGVPMGAAPD